MTETLINRLKAANHKADPLNRSLAMATRAGILTAIPLVLFLFSVLDENTALWSTVAVLYVSLSDVGGVYRRRVLALFITCVCTTAMAGIGAAITNIHWLLPIAMFFIAFVCSFLVLWNESASSVGVWALFAFLTSVGIPVDAGGALARTEIWFVSAFLAFALSVIVWSFKPHGMIGAALQELYRKLSLLTQELDQEKRKIKRRELVKLQSETMGLVEQMRAQHGESSQPQRKYLFFYRRFLALTSIALAVDEQRSRRTTLKTCQVVGTKLDYLSTLIGAELNRVVNGKLSLAGPEEALREATATSRAEAMKYRDDIPRFGELLVSAAELDYLEQMLDELQLIQDTLQNSEEHPDTEHQPVSIQNHIAYAVANLRKDSFAFRHAARVAVATALSTVIYTWFIPDPEGIGRYLKENHYWMTLTIVVIMVPHYSALFRRLGERIIGTLAGSLVAIAVIWWVRSPQVLALLLLPLGGLAFYFFRIRYWVFVFFITLWVLLLLNIGSPGHEDEVIARVLNTFAGALIAYLAGTFVLPSREHRTIRDVFCTVLEAHKTLLYEIDSDKAPLEQAEHMHRVTAGMLTAIERLGEEPGVQQDTLYYHRCFSLACEDLTAALLSMSRQSSIENIPIDDWQDQLSSLLSTLRTGHIEPQSSGHLQQDLASIRQKLLFDRSQELLSASEYHTRGRATLISVDVVMRLILRIARDFELLQFATAHIVKPSSALAKVDMPEDRQ
ncbi:MAG: FUSC family protein [Pseudomonadota bacterium]